MGTEVAGEADRVAADRAAGVSAVSDKAAKVDTAMPVVGLKTWEALVAKLEQAAKPLAADPGHYRLWLESIHKVDYNWAATGAEIFSGERLLAQRAMLLGVKAGDFWGRREPVSFGGACRMLRAQDGVMAVNLPRTSDWELVPAWLALAGGEVEKDAPGGKELPNWGAAFGGEDVPSGEASFGGEDVPGGEAALRWEALSELVRHCPTAELEAAGVELGMAVCEVGSFPEAEAVKVAEILTCQSPSQQTELSARGKSRCNRRRGQSLEAVKVADLSSMWAGPLCGDLLARLGAEVIKVESSSRPDGLRQGQPDFFDSLNRSKKHVLVDFGTLSGRRQLKELLLEADVVISSCRPRALEQLEIDPAEVVSATGGIWAGITGHGLFGPRHNRVAFGDDAAAAGGLVGAAEQLAPKTAVGNNHAAAGGLVGVAEQLAPKTAAGSNHAAAGGLVGVAEQLAPKTAVGSNHALPNSGLPSSGVSESALSGFAMSGFNLPDSDLPCFLGDALADPITGVFAAAAILGLWPHVAGAVLDISMAGAASYLRLG